MREALWGAALCDVMCKESTGSLAAISCRRHLLHILAYRIDSSVASITDAVCVRSGLRPRHLESRSR